MISIKASELTTSVGDGPRLAGRVLLDRGVDFDRRRVGLDPTALSEEERAAEPGTALLRERDASQLERLSL